MSNLKQALEILKQTKRCNDNMVADAKEKKAFGEAFDVAIQAVEIQIPQEVSDWHEDYGDCLWWSFPIDEPPYCGTPLDCDFPDHVTHFTRFAIPQN